MPKVSHWSFLACQPIMDDDVQSVWQIISNLQRSLSSIWGVMGVGSPPERQTPEGHSYRNTFTTSAVTKQQNQQQKEYLKYIFSKWFHNEPCSNEIVSGLTAHPFHFLLWYIWFVFTEKLLKVGTTHVVLGPVPESGLCWDSKYVNPELGKTLSFLFQKAK